MEAYLMVINNRLTTLLMMMMMMMMMIMLLLLNCLNCSIDHIICLFCFLFISILSYKYCTGCIDLSWFTMACMFTHPQLNVWLIQFINIYICVHVCQWRLPKQNKQTINYRYVKNLLPVNLKHMIFL